jgi:peptide/nickel transport system substrate-binding protein
MNIMSGSERKALRRNSFREQLRPLPRRQMADVVELADLVVVEEVVLAQKRDPARVEPEVHQPGRLDGLREKDGKRLELVAPLLSTYAGNQPAAELMNQQLQQIGVKLVLTPLTQGTLAPTLFSTGDYDVWPTLALSIPFQSGVFGLLGGPFPPDGTNAGHVSNKEFTALATKGNQTVGPEGCQLWIEAEKALFSNADAAPIAGVITNWVTNKASFQVMQGRIIPSSIRMTG